MIYTDLIHLITDGSIDELHEFAQRIGLKREWFQNHNRHPHYDLMGSKKEAALKAGAKVVPSREIVRILNERRTSH
jgi:hypothetical protein